MPSLLTLSEFAALAATAVRASGAAPENRQAKAVPAERMIRYYTARGLLPRPGTRGRALTYGRTHLLRLVAVKRLQGKGLSLEEIGERLNSMSAAELASLAAIPAGVIPAELGDPEPAPEMSRAAGRFWRAMPETAPAPAAARHRRRTRPRRRTQPRRRPPHLQAVRLSDTVTVLVDGPLPASTPCGRPPRRCWTCSPLPRPPPERTPDEHHPAAVDPRRSRTHRTRRADLRGWAAAAVEGDQRGHRCRRDDRDLDRAPAFRQLRRYQRGSDLRVPTAGSRWCHRFRGIAGRAAGDRNAQRARPGPHGLRAGLGRRPARRDRGGGPLRCVLGAGGQSRAG
ncbi:merR HTH regulatory family protein [Mycobacterium kansasii 732]|nr:merR HTH regulatory family protein [Mycobacterium kansasii 732]